MPEMTEKEAIELLERAKLLHEQLDMENDIRHIDCILSQFPINIDSVKAKICTINEKHKENILINHMIFPPRRPASQERAITDAEYISDLSWKRTYLKAKKDAKAFTELYKEMWNYKEPNQ